MALRFLLLMRHAKHTRGRPEEKPKGFGLFKCHSDTVLTAEGTAQTLAVAMRFREFVDEQTKDPKVELAAVRYFPNPETEETAETFCKGSGFAARDRPTETQLLGPMTEAKDLRKTRGESELEHAVKVEAKDALRTAKAHGVAGNAVLFIGHQPAIGWLAEALLGDPVPAAQSELLCLELDGKRRPRLLWCISSADEDVLEELKEKIKSKMSLANLLSAFITAGIGILITALLDKSKIAQLGVQAYAAFLAAATLGVAVALYLGTMFSYDRLLMPPRFWADTASGTENRPSWIVARPPSGIHWILYQNMLRVWQRQFVPATLLVLFGLSLLGSAAFWSTWRSCCPEWSNEPRALALSIGIPVILPLAFLVRRLPPVSWVTRNFRRWVGPWLGSED